MAVVTVLTAERMLEIEAESVVSGAISGNELILTKHDGTTVDAGNVRGPQGAIGSQGPQGGILPIVSALPGSPSDGQVIHYQNAAMAADGVVWVLRYRAGSASAYKWEFIGGQPLVFEDFANTPTRSSSAWGAPSANPLLAPWTAPLTGDWDFQCGFTGYDAGSVSPHAMMGIVSAAVTNTPPMFCQAAGQNLNESVENRRRYTGVGSGTNFYDTYASGFGTQVATFSARWFYVKPIRVG